MSKRLRPVSRVRSGGRPWQKNEDVDDLCAAFEDVGGELRPRGKVSKIEVKRKALRHDLNVLEETAIFEPDMRARRDQAGGEGEKYYARKEIEGLYSQCDENPVHIRERRHPWKKGNTPF